MDDEIRVNRWKKKEWKSPIPIPSHRPEPNYPDLAVTQYLGSLTLRTLCCLSFGITHKARQAWHKLPVIMTGILWSLVLLVDQKQQSIRVSISNTGLMLDCRVMQL